MRLTGWRRLSATEKSTILLGAAAAIVITVVVLTMLWPSPPAGTRRAVDTAVDLPYQTEAGWACPNDRPVRAFADGHSYPAGHPRSPAEGSRPTRCFVSAAAAAAGGYPEAPLPAGSIEIGGVYLAPVDTELSARCRRIAQQLRFAIPCPGLLPTEEGSAPGSTACAFGADACVWNGAFLLDDGMFIVPPAYHGVDGRAQGHLVLFAAGSPTDQRLHCTGEHRIGMTRIHRAQAVAVACPKASEVNGGHLLIRWHEGSIFITLSLHGVNEVNRKLLIALATHISLISI
jgi:hypothetical protein